MLKHQDYDFVHYRSEFAKGVNDVLADLPGDDTAGNEARFHWKYEQNPHADGPLGIVALHQGRLVGFLGYNATRWQTGAGRTMSVLVPGDTCVDLNHRRKGLSVAMGKLAARDYVDSHRLFLNLSCTRESLPGYLRLDYAPIADKVYLSRYTSFGLAHYLLNSKRQLPLSAAGIRLGLFDGVIVSDKPEPAGMASVVAGQNKGNHRFFLCQEEDYFDWRFAGPGENSFSTIAWSGTR